MRRRKALITLVAMVAVSAIALGATFALGNAPLLGLDLEGGVSVRLTPTSAASDEQIDQAIAIMDQRINSLGVAEPDIHREGGTIVVEIAGLKDEDKDKAIELVGQTAELRFRPVLQVLAAEPPAATEPAEGAPGSTSTTAPAEPGTTAPASPAGGEGETGMRAPAAPVEGESAAAAQTPTTASDQPATTAAPATEAAAPNACGSTTPPPEPDPSKTTTPEEDNQRPSACAKVVLKADPRTDPSGQRYLLGPACNPVDQQGSCLTGAALKGATAGIDETGKWAVNPEFKGGEEGIDKFNALAEKCYNGAPECPALSGRGQMAITLDGLVLTAPTINESRFSADQIRISGSFKEDTARAVATALKYGALPVQLRQESSETVSATLGRDALDAGIAAGVVGFVLVAAYLVAFYRIMGLMAIAKLGVEFALMWSIISYLGTTAGLALTLAGVMGIIMSIGVSLDSNVVYYEHMREDIRSGRTLRSAVDRSFGTAMGTILKADGASLLGALLLYWLAVGPVKGFAFFLGLSTLLELITSYYFMRPIAYLLSTTRLCRRHPAWFGLPHELAVAEEVPSTIRPRPSRGGRRAQGAPRSDQKRGQRPSPAADAPAEPGDPTPPDTDQATSEANR